MASYAISSGGARLIGYATIPVPFATILVILRFVARRKIRSIGPDDYAILVALISYYGLWSTIVATAVVGHAGWNAKYLTLPQIENFLKIFYCMQIIYAFVGPAAKISILLLYRRIFPVMKMVMWSTFIAGLLVFGWSMGVLFSVIFQCLPVGSFWLIPERTSCINSWAFYWANGISNLLLDFLILLLPMPVIWRLQMSTKKKFMTTGVFSIGLFVCAISILRVTAIFEISLENITETTVLPNIWTSLEPGFSIIACCLPTVQPLIKRGRNTTTNDNSRVTEIDEAQPSVWSTLRSRMKLGSLESSDRGDSRQSSQFELYAGPPGKVSTSVGVTSKANSWEIETTKGESSGIRRDTRISMETGDE